MIGILMIKQDTMVDPKGQAHMTSAGGGEMYVSWRGSVVLASYKLNP